MNKALLFLLIGSCAASTAFSQDTTTFYIVRHADRDGKKDALTKAGMARAESLKQIMVHLNVDKVYSTDFDRTKQTVGPTAQAIGVPTVLYGRISPEWFAEMKKANKGQVVLIAGHSNTVVPMINGLGVKLEYRIAEDEFDNLFVVQVGKDQTGVVQLKYGATRKTKN